MFIHPDPLAVRVSWTHPSQEAALEYGVRLTGATVHFVDSEYPVPSSAKAVEVMDDTPKAFVGNGAPNGYCLRLSGCSPSRLSGRKAPFLEKQSEKGSRMMKVLR